jgi:hypothetical protein
MNHALFRYAIAFLIIHFVIFGCAGNDGTTNTESNVYPDGEIESLVWETNGGGDIKFSITRAADEYEISVERYDFQPVDVSIILTDSDPEVYSLVDEIFNQVINVYDHTVTPEGDTGTWTAITLTFSGNQVVEIDDIKTGDEELWILCDFVNENTVPAL